MRRVLQVSSLIYVFSSILSGCGVALYKLDQATGKNFRSFLGENAGDRYIREQREKAGGETGGTMPPPPFRDFLNNQDPVTRSAEPRVAPSQPLFNECMKKYSLKECEKFKEGNGEDEARHQ